MPISDYMRRLLLDTLASNINEVILGFDGTPATTDDDHHVTLLARTHTPETENYGITHFSHRTLGRPFHAERWYF